MYDEIRGPVVSADIYDQDKKLVYHKFLPAYAGWSQPEGTTALTWEEALQTAVAWARECYVCADFMSDLMGGPADLTDYAGPRGPHFVHVEWGNGNQGTIEPIEFYPMERAVMCSQVVFRTSRTMKYIVDTIDDLREEGGSPYSPDFSLPVDPNHYQSSMDYLSCMLEPILEDYELFQLGIPGRLHPHQLEWNAHQLACETGSIRDACHGATC